VKGGKQGGELVVLVHGIWMKGLEWRLMARRLRREGHEVRIFRYPSLGSAPADNARRLARFIAAAEAQRVHLVAHSLGGILVLHLLAADADLPPGRVVLIGTPAAGSRLARRLNAFLPGRWLLGRSVDQGLLGDVPAWRGGRDLGIIAGDLSLGVGRLIGGVATPNDGTVAVEETRVQGATDFRIIHGSHLGLLFLADTATAVAHFLARGRFPTDSCPPK